MSESGSNNKTETQKLYTLLLPYSIYDNPYKQYSRKLKLKKQPIISQSTPSEFIVFSPYW